MKRLREMEVLSKSSGAWFLCAIHAGRNHGLTSAEEKDLIGLIAKACTQPEFDYYSDLLRDRDATKTKNVDDFLASSDEWSTLSMFQKGVLTNFGEITSNSSEQAFSDKALREKPVVDLVLRHLEQCAKRFAARKANALRQQSAGSLVVDDQMSEMVTKARHNFRSFRVVITELSPLQIKLQVINSNVAQLSYTVTLTPEAPGDFTERMDCSCCQHRMFGLPCEHAGFGLVYLRTFLRDFFDSHGQTLSEHEILKFEYNRPAWFHEAHHVKTYVEQYSGTGIKLPASNAPFVPVPLYPPSRLIAASRHRRERLKSRLLLNEPRCKNCPLH